MPLEAPLAPLANRVAALNARFEGHGAISVLSHSLRDPEIGRLALVSSFGAESVVLLHMVSVIDRSLPVVFLDTEMLFAETLAYQRDLASRFGLSDIRRIRPSRAALFERDAENLLHQYDPDACCALRKVEPLERAMKGFDGWITGRKRFQGGVRKSLAFFEIDGAKIKVNPLAFWDRGDLKDYIANNNLPRHPLVNAGYPSLGCAPCTAPAPDEGDGRSGRWQNFEKTECGLHMKPMNWEARA